MSTIEKSFSSAVPQPTPQNEAGGVATQTVADAPLSSMPMSGYAPSAEQNGLEQAPLGLAQPQVLSTQAPQVTPQGIQGIAPVTQHFLERRVNASAYPSYFEEIPDEPKVNAKDSPAKAFLKKLWQAPDMVLAGAIGLTVFAWVAIYALTAFHPQFVSNARVIIKDSAMTTNYVVPGQTTAIQTTSSNASNPVLNMMGLLGSTQVKEALYNYFSTQRPEELKKLKIKDRGDWDTYFTDGSKIVKAKNIVGTDLITLQMGWTDAKTSQQALSVVVKAFQDTSLSINKAEQKTRSQYLDKQVSVINGKLKAVREQKSRFKRQSGTASLLRQADDLTRTRIETETALSQTLAKASGRVQEMNRYQSMLGGMNSRTALQATAVGLDPSMTKLQDQLYTLKQQLADSSSMYTNEHPKVLQLKAQIVATEGEIASERTRSGGGSGVAITDSTRGTIIGSLAAAHADANNQSAQAGQLRARLGEIDRQLAAYPAVEEGLANLEQDERSLSGALDTLRQKQIEAQIKESETMSNIVVVDQPNVPKDPKFPTVNHLLIIGALLGLGSAAGVLAAKRRYFLHMQGDKPGSVGMLWFDLPGASDGKQLGAPVTVAGTLPSPSESANMASPAGYLPNAQGNNNVPEAFKQVS
jgi:uncharacterized protein involved in exopolysaccharide biosynthesis